MEGNENSSGVGLAFLQGAVFGAVTALLLAPRSGRELRQQLRDYAQETGERVREFAEEGRETVNKAIDKGREAAQDAYQAAQSAAQREREQLAGKARAAGA